MSQFKYYGQLMGGDVIVTVEGKIQTVVGFDGELLTLAEGAKTLPDIYPSADPKIVQEIVVNDDTRTTSVLVLHSSIS
ncbi:hypothetical protein ABH924_005059 [Arthrobacter sp. GAS37]|uniref:hypothetical protein n=1 Tax=Arthrobacter sp. GAS37 TaxID=3156261 RepID=UPI0038374A31